MSLPDPSIILAPAAVAVMRLHDVPGVLGVRYLAEQLDIEFVSADHPLPAIRAVLHAIGAPAPTRYKVSSGDDGQPVVERWRVSVAEWAG
jgi:hypothetical protein